MGKRKKNKDSTSCSSNLTAIREAVAELKKTPNYSEFCRIVRSAGCQVTNIRPSDNGTFCVTCHAGRTHVNLSLSPSGRLREGIIRQNLRNAIQKNSK